MTINRTWTERLLQGENSKRRFFAGTYFLESDLIINFEEYCAGPLELYDNEIKRLAFEHYERVLYVRQPRDPDLVSRAAEVAEFLQLCLEIQNADYSHLEQILADLV